MANDETKAGSPGVNSDAPVRLRVKVDGETLHALPIVTLTVRRAVNRIPWAKIVLADGDMSTGTFDWSDKPTFAPGAKVTISAGYGEEETALFEGVVVRHSVKIDGPDHSRLVIECHDHANAGDVNIKAPNTSGPAVVKCMWGSNLISFDADIDAAKQENILARVSGRMRFRGNASALPDSLIEVKGVGARFSGAVYVAGVEHEFCNDDWVTLAEFGLRSEWFAAREVGAAMSNNDLIPGLIGLQLEDGIVTVITPGKNRVVLDDKNRAITVQDQHENTIQLSSTGIELNSKSDLRLTAQGNVTITADASIDGNAKGGDLKMTGLNVKCEALVGFTAKGSVSAELSASGHTTVKGAMVMIN
jgi:hypothetical protein